MKTNYQVSSHVKSKYNAAIRAICGDKSRYVTDPEKDFTRNRLLGFKDTFCVLLQMDKGTTYSEVQKYFNTAQIPTTTAFFKRQSKITVEAYKDMFETFTNCFYHKMKTFKGYRVLAVDGSVVMTPLNKKDPDLYRKNNTCSIYVNSTHDVLNNIYTDIDIENSFKSDERDSFIRMFERCSYKEKCIWMADRGYEAANVFAHVIEGKSKFVFRVRDINSNSTLGKYHLPNEEFDIDIIKVVAETMKSVKEVPIPEGAVVTHMYGKRFDFFTEEKRYYELKLRVVRFETIDGKHQAIITNIPREEMSTYEIKELYHKRWGIETAFRHLKYNVGLNYFHSMKKDMIKKEIYARVIVYNFVGLIVCQLKIKEKIDRKLDYKINTAAAIVICKAYIDKHGSRHNVDLAIAKNLSAIRPNRPSTRRGRHEHKAKGFQHR